MWAEKKTRKFRALVILVGIGLGIGIGYAIGPKDSVEYCDLPESCVDVCDNVHSGKIPSYPIGLATSGTAANIYPNFLADVIEVYCDCSNEESWTVFHRRFDGSVDFYRNWEEYAVGFGNVTGEYWLGLENLNIFTPSGATLRVDLEDWDGSRAYAEYRNFSIASREDGYAITARGYSGDAGHSLVWHDGQKFSARDRDLDNSDCSCANVFNGGWWFETCFSAHLNGPYLQGPETEFPIYGMAWNTWHKGRSKKSAEMKFRL